MNPKTKSLAKKIRAQWAKQFAGYQLMRFGKWKSISGLTELAVEHFRGKVGLEIGSFSGESAVIMILSGVTHLTCVDPWAAVTWSKHPMTEIEARFDRTAGLFKNVTKLKGFGRDVIPKLTVKFDFVYVDGDHKKKGVIEDIGLAMSVLRPGGIIAGHDYARSIWPEVKVAVDEIFGKPEKVYRDSSWMVTIK